MNSECKLFYRNLIFSCALFFLLISSFSSSSAQTFYSKSKNGVLHFTNVPPQEEGYRRFKIPWTSLRSYTGRSLGSFKYSNRFDDNIYTTAKLYGVDPMLIKAMIKVESNFNHKAVSPKGAMGVMQLMPQTARRVGVRNPYDPAQNIRGGVKYFKMLTNMFNGNLRLALAGYNAGEEAVIEYGYRIPPYPETINYVDKVFTHYEYLKGKHTKNGNKSLKNEKNSNTPKQPLPKKDVQVKKPEKKNGELRVVVEKNIGFSSSESLNSGNLTDEDDNIKEQPLVHSGYQKGQDEYLKNTYANKVNESSNNQNKSKTPKPSLPNPLVDQSKEPEKSEGSLSVFVEKGTDLSSREALDSGDVKKHEGNLTSRALGRSDDDVRGEFTIQVGSFKYPENATEMKETLESSDYPVYIQKVKLQGKGVWYRVRVGEYTTRKEAKELSDTLKNNEPSIKSPFITAKN